MDNVSLKLEHGSRWLIKGCSGSGKTTLLQVITGLLEPNSGHIIANQERLNDELLDCYRKNIGQSLKAESPFEGTLLENLTYGDDTVPMDKLYDIINMVGLDPFVRNSEDGLDTVIYPEGKQVSYTVSRKIVLARSLLKDPKLIVLRDPLDQFDEGDTERIINYLTDPDKGWTLVVVSNHPAWQTKLDNVLTLQDGKLIK